MKPHVRRAIAYIAACVISDRRSTAIYDYTSSKYYNFSINLSESGIAAYDYTHNSHISGSYFSLYHYGESHHISFKIDGDRFSGFDYGTSSHFSGSVKNNSIVMYDYSVSSYFNFSIN